MGKMDDKGVTMMSPILLSFLLLISNFHPTHGGELELLSSFKSLIKDPLNSLSSWNLSVSFCNWHGITCDNISHVTTIELSGKNLSGRLSPAIFQLSKVEVIHLSNNQLYGEIPRNIFSCSSLRLLNLSDNTLNGSIPHGSSSRLETLDLSNNMLVGKIPREIGSFSSLKYIDIGGNVLKGKIPGSISNITSLQFLTLASNQLVGKIPNEIGQMKSLKWIYLGYNNLSGEIPAELGNMLSLNHLDLVFNNLTGHIPSSLGKLKNLQYLFLYQNKLTGSIPESIFGLRNLISLDLSDNYLSGEIPELIIQLENLEVLQLFSNNFTGKVPKALAFLPRLRVLQLWSNQLSGKIPENLGQQNNLTILDLSTNRLTGKIPESLCNSGSLSKLILFANSLEGDIPKSLSHCKSLIRVRIENNHLSGALSSEFTQLPLVNYLDISGNNLSGRIDDRKWDMPVLQMLNLARNMFIGNLPESFGSKKLENLDLSGNQFSGKIPGSFGSLSELMKLKLSENELYGDIPEDLSSLKKLVSLDVSHNKLSGQIPGGLAEMPVLGQLDLSENQLSGEIPPSLGKVASLVEVNVSYNHFHGSLPSTGAFLVINASAVTGNDLCGGDNVTGLPPCRSTKNPIWWFVLMCLMAALAVVIFGYLTIVFIRRRKVLKLNEVENKDETWEVLFFDSRASKSVTVDDILSSRKQENVVPGYRKGVLSYIVKSLVNNMQFFVKEINDAKSISSTFWSEAVELGKIKHKNIVNMIGLCWSKNNGYIIYEHVDGTNLREVLCSLRWERRRKIAVYIAKLMKFLHYNCSPSILVGDMSPENVVVDGRDEPHLILSPLKLVCIIRKGVTPLAYAAPETKDAQEITEMSDVYGFGLLLIELLTGKSPADAEFGANDMSIVDWARYCYSDCHLDSWIDPMIRADSHALKDQNQIVETMNLALKCTAVDPTARPTARDLVEAIESAMKRRSVCVLGLKLSLPF